MACGTHNDRTISDRHRNMGAPSHEEQAAMNALCTYAGTTHIWTDDPLQPVISLDYTVDTETYISSVMGGLRFAINPGDMGLDIIY